LSTLYELYYDLYEGGRLPWKLEELHAEFGTLLIPTSTNNTYNSQIFISTYRAHRPNRSK